LKKFNSVSDLVRDLQPVNPVYCIRPESIKLACNFFVNNFPGKPLYAVKTNPHKSVIKHIYQNGITNFDVASLEEIKLVNSIAKDAKLYFMHTVKNRKSIEEAYFNYGVRDFSFDTKDELIKIFEATKDAKDLTLYLRIFVSNEHSEIDLSKKFGASTTEAIGLIKLVRPLVKKLGVSFHVGSQCMHPVSYSKGIKEIGNIITKSGITPDIINVGGGFPSKYPDLYPQPLENYMEEIKKAVNKLNLPKQPELICEPGRAIVAESGSTIVKVELRKKQSLYINDGTYGSLFDAGVPNFIFPTKVIDTGKDLSRRFTPFNFYGPTCDSMDFMKGPYMLPNNLKEGDYIEIGQLGSYGLTFRTKFNGFYSDDIFEIDDKPIMSVYQNEQDEEYKSNYLVA
jgi:ornithine decarboxylase